MKLFLGFHLMADKLHSLICPVKVWFSLRFMADTHKSPKKKQKKTVWRFLVVACSLGVREKPVV